MQPPPAPRLRRGPALAGIVALLAVLLVPLSVIAVLADPHPELRVTPLEARLNVLVVDGDERALIVNTDDREFARALMGRLARPWEPGPTLLISPSDEGAAIGLWELLQHSEPAAIMVAGIPGAAPLWNDIERESRQRGIDLLYVTGRASVATGRLTIEVLAPEPEQVGDHIVIVQRGDTRTLIALGDGVPAEPGHVLIGTSDGSPSVDLVINADRSTRASTLHEVVIGPRQIARVTLSPSQISVSGGTLRVPVADAEP